MSSRTRELERTIEVALTVGVALSGILLVTGLLLGASRPLRWGVLLLIVTPVARVVVVTVGLVRERDWLFSAVSIFVLAVLLSSVYVGGRL